MKLLIIGAIRLYQWIAPNSIRERCIFSPSCSNYVLEGARVGGAIMAWARFWERTRKCRAGYSRVDVVGAQDAPKLLVLLTDGSVVDETALSEKVKAEFLRG